MGGEEKWRERGAKCLLLASWRYRGTRMISLVTRADPSCSGEVGREGLWVGDIGRGRGEGGVDRVPLPWQHCHLILGKGDSNTLQSCIYSPVPIEKDTFHPPNLGLESEKG